MSTQGAQQKKKVFMTGICDRIRALTVERGMANYELASKADVAAKTIYSIMHGKSVPRHRIVMRIASALDTTVPYLLTGQGPKECLPIPAGGPMVLRESGTVYPEKGERMIAPCTFVGAIRKIAVELEIPELDVVERVIKVLREEVTSKKEGHV